MIESIIVDKITEPKLNNKVEDYQSFGWNIVSYQKIDYVTTYRTGGGNSQSGYNYIVHNDQTAYFTILFNRDKEMEHYDELNELYKKYQDCENKINDLWIKYYNAQSKPNVPAFIINFILFFIYFNCWLLFFS